MSGSTPEKGAGEPHKRRPRYPGKYPRRFEHKYKEHSAEAHPEVLQKVIASGKTAAGSHRPIMVNEVLDVLRPGPGMVVVDCTLGYGGHAEQLLRRIHPGGKLIGIDADPIELPRTEARLRGKGFGKEVFGAYRSNFAGLPAVLTAAGVPEGAHCVLADLGVSSMQLDDPSRGFSIKEDGPLDMRMNPGRGRSAAEWLGSIREDELATLLRENADEPESELLARGLAGKQIPTTGQLREAILGLLGNASKDEKAAVVRRVFQALRIAVNGELSALENLLRVMPVCLSPGGRVAILSFHSGEDRRVKKAFEQGLRGGVYSEIADDVIRPGAEERYANPRSTPARLRWAQRVGGEFLI